MSSADAAIARAAARRERSRGLLALARVSNVPTVLSGALAGAVLAAGDMPPAGRTITAALALGALYLAGMVLNDLLDVEVDRRERPERPLPSGAVTTGEAWTAFGVLLAAGLAGLAALGLAPLASGAVLVAFVVLYDARHKGNALSPVLMGACRALVYITAALAVQPSLPGSVLLAAGLLALFTVAITALAKREGHGPVAAWWPVLALAAAPLVWLPQAATPVGMAAGAAALLVVGLATVLVRRGAVREAVGLGIAAMALYDASVIATVDGAWPAVLLAVGAFVATVLAQRRVAGT